MTNTRGIRALEDRFQNRGYYSFTFQLLFCNLFHSYYGHIILPYKNSNITFEFVT